MHPAVPSKGKLQFVPPVGQRYLSFFRGIPVVPVPLVAIPGLYRFFPVAPAAFGVPVFGIPQEPLADALTGAPVRVDPLERGADVDAFGELREREAFHAQLLCCIS